ncbi:hypothetical protein C9374_014564 [Naegleria lovaniensis]|uniref:Kynureninase n=1 Tax=Naegleria lovaniensis TaxID=51637 RepID=A0AA88H0R3_NAELO|nr:uncharacterized protein C9374_014564 [Naegleria lovaniensis]KAG2389164.1 hypothetical protein C9374_014564 [Naegleria lovaniensis]
MSHFSLVSTSPSSDTSSASSAPTFENYNFQIYRGQQQPQDDDNTKSESSTSHQEFLKLAHSYNYSLSQKELAITLDENDPLKHMRNEFNYPDMIPSEFIQENKDHSECVKKRVMYFCGNSLGLQPKSLAHNIEKELTKWSHIGVEGHFSSAFGTNKWFQVEESVKNAMAKIVGAKPIEVTVMNSLTANLQVLLMSFYRPTKQKYKILIEQFPFPSDMHAVTSHIKCRIGELRAIFENENLTSDEIVEKCIVQVGPREGEEILRTEDIVDCLKSDSHICVSLIGGVQFMTGQCFDMKTIAKTCQECGIICGFDLAHAAGNIDLRLHEWGCDFACWCSYKYLNSGPGGISGIFVHEKHAYENMDERPRFMGWWSRDAQTRFSLSSKFSPQPGAAGFQMSNPCILSMTAILSSLKVFEMIEQDGQIMSVLRKKSVLLTTYLELLLRQELGDKIQIITPSDSNMRGCQLSVRVIGKNLHQVDNALKKRGIIIDTREPDIIRVSPVPLYNQFIEVFDFVSNFKEILNE